MTKRTMSVTNIDSHFSELIYLGVKQFVNDFAHFVTKMLLLICCHQHRVAKISVHDNDDSDTDVI